MNHGDIQRRLDEGEELFQVILKVADSCPFKSLKAQWIAQRLCSSSDFVDVEPDIEDPSLPQSIDEYTFIFSGGSEETQQVIESEIQTDSEVENIMIRELSFEENQDKALSQDSEASNKKSAKTGSKNESTQTLRVEVGKINALGNLVGEMVIGNDSVGNACRLLQQATSLDDVGPIITELRKTHQDLTRLTTELQDRSMEIRMVPLNTVFRKFQRVVRDLAANVGKKVELISSGGETELDKTVVERINDPLVHIIRNAIDHGIESQSVRKKASKPSMGSIKLNATNEGGMVVLKIEDDGAGLDIERIKEKALQQGLVTETSLSTMKRKDILALIFNPGLSTAKTVTDTAGRGVGMDVVKTSIGRLGGIIETKSMEGHGTSFTIKLPLTLSIVNVQLVKVGVETMAIPVSNVQNIFRYSPSELRSINGKPAAQRKGKVIPLVQLASVLGMPPSGETSPYVVEVFAVEAQAGIEVDEVLGQQDVVIKNLGPFLGRIPGISGGTILGNGDVAMILDTREILDRASATPATNNMETTA